MRHSQLALANSLRLENLMVSINSSWQVTKADITLGTMMINRGKLRFLAPLYQNRIQQFKSRKVSLWCPRSEKLISLNACILCLASCPSTTPRSEEHTSELQSLRHL